LDSVAHRELGSVPTPFHPKAKDRASRMFVEAYETIDRHLAELLRQVSLDSSHVMVFGDHGLVPVEAELNLRKIPGAEPGALSALDFEIGGGMTLAYLKAGSDEKLAMEQLQGMRALLQPLDVVEKFVLASEATTPWQYGDALGAIHGKLGTTLRDGGENKPWQGKPHYSGNHGFLAEDPAMATGWIIAGPKVARSVRQGKVDDQPHSLLEVMPTALALIDVPVPAQCEKAPLRF
jgi:arylsulfatase A-like enzyme